MANKAIEFLLNAKDATASAFNSLKKRLDTTEAKIAGLGKSAQKTWVTVTAAFAAIGGAAAIKSAVSGMAELGGGIRDLSNQTGIAFGEIQRLQYAAKMSGIEVGSLDSALQTMSEKLGKALGGDQKTKDFLAALGIDTAKVKTADEGLKVLADTFKTLGSDPESMRLKAAALKELKIDPSLLPMLSEGREGIEALGDEADRLGGILSDKSVNAFADFGDSMNHAKTLTQGLTAEFVSGIIPGLKNTLDAFTDTGKGGGEAFEILGKYVSATVRAIVSTLDFAGTRIANFGRMIGGTVAAVQAGIEQKSFSAFMGTMNMVYDDIGAANKRQVERFEKTWDIGGANAGKAAGEGLKTGITDPKTVKAAQDGLKKYFGSDSAKAAKDAASKIGKAIAEAFSKLATDAEKRHQEKLKELLDDGLISWNDYYDGVVKSQQKAIDLRIQALQDERRLAKDKGEVAKIDAEITILERDRLDAAGKAAREQAKAEKDLVKQLDDVRYKTKEILGTLTADDRKKIIETSYEDLIKKAQAAGQDVGVITQAMAIEVAKAEFDSAEQKITEARSKAEAAISQAESLLNAGLITNAEHRERVAQANTSLVASMDSATAAMGAQAAVLGGDYITKVQAAQTEIKNLAVATDAVAASINKSFKDALTDGIESMITGERNPIQALKDVFKGVGKAIARQLSEDLSSSLYKMLKSSGFNIGEMVSSLLKGNGASGGGLGGFFSTIAKGFGFQSGGYTGNGGVSQIAGAVHGQEYVISAPATRRLGVKFLDSLHAMARGGAAKLNIGGFADGGYVAPVAAAAAGGINVPVTVIAKDADSFRKSQSQIQRDMGLAVQKATRRLS